MILRKLEFRPFAGFLQKEISFAPGLNVVLGPNDAGKSTIFRGLQCLLLLPVKVSRSTKEGRDLLPRLLPIGGDRASARLGFSAKGKNWLLEKTWGSGASALLGSEGGASLADEERIEAQLQECLPVPPATLQSVLLMGQNALEGTVEELSRKRESLHSLGDVLRVAVDQTGGVSVDRLKSLLAKRLDDAFRYWDRNANLPEKGRGIEDPWKKNLGSILSAYYARELARRDWQQTLALENRRDLCVASTREFETKRAELREFVRGNAPLIETASARALLEERIGKARGDCEAMQSDLKAWIQAESDRRLFVPEVERLEEAKKKLDAEMQAALAQAKRRDTLARFEKAKTAQHQLEEARKRLGECPTLKAEDLRRIRAATQEVESLRTGLKAGKIQLQFTAKKDIDLVFKKDLDPERRGTMTVGKTMTVNAGGRVRLESELFELQVTSGDGNLRETEEALAARSDALGKLLASFGVAGLEEAQNRHERWLDAAQAVKSAESALAALLAGEKFEELERLANAGGLSGSVRDPELVQAELLHVIRELGPKKEGAISAQRRIQDLSQRYKASDSDHLMERMVGRKAELRGLEQELSALPPLPESIGNLKDFLPRFERAKSELELLQEEINKLAVQLAELGGQLPEKSAQDFARDLEEAEAAFELEFARGRALLRVEAAMGRVEGQAGDIFEGFRGEYTALVSRLSGGKYSQARMEESLPNDFLRADGASVPYGWLSAGTKDSFALALRLAMARHFLKDAEGFLLIDDPMVAMDPARQEVAADLLRDFAGSRQVVVFTCHPSHAERLGGNCIRL
jgi:DNA repair protein SbcC/Rad50